jgi:hypothetical protein
MIVRMLAAKHSNMLPIDSKHSQYNEIEIIQILFALAVQADGIPISTNESIIAEIIGDPRMLEVAGAASVLLPSF